MNISSFAKRSIANQKSFSFDFLAAFSNSTGSCRIGFSGSSVFEFVFQNGQVYGPEDEYVWSYSPEQEIFVSGDWVSGNYHYFINGSPIEIKNNPSSGFFSEFYVDPSGLSVDFETNIRGKAPSISIFFPDLVLTGNSATGYIVNNETDPELAFQIFSGSINGDSLSFSLDSLPSGYKISGGQSGAIVISHSGTDLEELTSPISFYTDFGSFNFETNLSATGSPFDFLSFSLLFSGIVGSDFFTYSEFDFNLGLITQELQPLTILAWDGGGNTGEITGEVPITGDMTGSASPFVYVSSFAQFPIFGTASAIYPNESGDYVTFPISGDYLTEIFATGDIVYNYSIEVDSVESGLLPPFVCSGFISGQGIGYIVGSGYLTGIDSGLMTGSFFGFEYTDFATGLFNLFQYATGTFTFNYTALATGLGITAYGTGEVTALATGSRTFDITDADFGVKRFNEIFSFQIPSTFSYDWPLVPKMTALTEPSGLSSAYSESFESWFAFDRNEVSYITTAETGFVQYKFPSGTTQNSKLLNVRGFSVTVTDAIENELSGLRVLGSNDGQTWTSLYYVESPTFTNNVFRALTTSTGNFDYLRLEQSGTAAISSINFFNPLDTTGYGFVNEILNPNSAEDSGHALSTHFLAAMPPIYAFDNNENTTFRAINVLAPVDGAVMVGDDYGFPSYDIGANAAEIYGVTGDGLYNYYWGEFINAFGAVRTNFAITNKQHSPMFQTLEDNLNITLPVYAFAKSGNTFYIPTPSLKKVDNWSTITTLNVNPNNTTHAIELCEHGIFIGGKWTNITGAAAAVWGTTGLAKLTSQGALDPSVRFNLRGNTIVNHIEELDDKIYFCGDFDALVASGRNMAYFVSNRLDNIWNFSGMNSGINDTVRCVLWSGSKIFVGGDFTSVGGDSQKRGLVGFDINGNLLPFRADVAGSVYSLAISGNTLFAGGAFSSAKGTLRTGLCAFDINAAAGVGTLSSWSPRLNSTSAIAYDMVYESGIVYVGGNFTSINAATKNRYAIIDINGNVNAFNANFNSDVYTLEKRRDDIFIGGAFSTVGGIGRNRLCMLSSAGLLSPWNPNSASSVFEIITGANNEIYVGGAFTSMSGLSQYSRLAKFNGDLSLDSSFETSFEGDVNGLAYNTQGNNLVVVGDFASDYIGNGALLDTGGNILFNSGYLIDTNLELLGTKIISGRVFNYGNFTSIGFYCPNLMAINPNGSPYQFFTPIPNGPVSGFAFSGNHMYIGGNFSKLRDETSLRFNHLTLPNGESGSACGINMFDIQSRICGVKNISGDIFLYGDLRAINGLFVDPVKKLTNGVYDPVYGAKVAGTVNDMYHEATSGAHIVVGNLTGYGSNMNLSYFFGGGSGKHVDYFKITPGDYPPTFFSTWGSNDGSSWEFLHNYGVVSLLIDENYYFENPTTGIYDYFRLELGYGSGYDDANAYSDLRAFSLYGDDGDFLKVMTENYTGSGNFSNTGYGLIYGSIEDQSGLQPAIGVWTGTVSGIISGGSGTYLFHVTRTGDPDAVYLNYEIDSTPATGAFYFPSGFSGLNFGDTISINGYSFSPFTGTVSPSAFGSLADLVGLINSGESGLLGFNFTTGYNVFATLDGDNILLESHSIFGKSGNLIPLDFSTATSGTVNYSAPFLFGGSSVRPSISGPFYSTYTGFDQQFTGFNSGIYDVFGSESFVGSFTGTYYRDRFDLSWVVESGFSNSGFNNIPWIDSISMFSGESIVDAIDNLVDIAIGFQKLTPFGSIGGSLIYEISIGTQSFTGQIYA